MSAATERADSGSRLNLVTAPAPANSNPVPDAEPTARTAPAAAPQVEAAPAKSGSISKRILLGTVAAVLLATAAYYGTHWWTVGRFMVSTDDAYVRAQNTTLAAKTAGYVSRILVTDNEAVQSGQVIARIDDGDFRLAAEAAREK